MAYPTLRQLTEEIRGIIDNASWDVTTIEPKVNEVYAEVCEHERVRLPALETSTTLTTSTTLNYVALPTDIQLGRKMALFACKNASQSYIDVPVYSSLSVLLSNFSDYNQTGSVQGIAVRGGNLHYQRIPSTAETLLVFYWKKATLMAIPDSDTPILVPSESLARRLMVHGTCAKIFPRIYQDAPQTHPMVMEHKQEFGRAFAELVSLVGPWDRGFSSFSA